MNVSKYQVLLLLIFLSWFDMTGNAFSLLDSTEKINVVVSFSTDDPAVRQAAEELSAILNLLGQPSEGEPSSKLYLAIAGVDSSADQTVIRNHFSLDRLGYDGFLLDRLDDQNYILIAPNGRGLQNGIYKILEHNLGIAFPRPLAQLDFPIGVKKITELAIPYTETPAFPLRGLSLSSELQENVPTAMYDWMSRNYMNQAAQSPASFGNLHEELVRYGFWQMMATHAFHYWVPGEMIRQHPEYYALVNGQRTTKTYLGGQLALGNPELIDFVANRMIEYMKITPELEVLSFGYNDCDEEGFGFGDDPLCLALDSPRDLPKAGSQRPRTWSTRYIKAANRVIEKVNCEFPQVKLHVYAYHWEMMQPPDCEISPNLIIEFAPLYKCGVHAMNDSNCPRNVLMNEWLLGWVAKSKNIIFRDYYFVSPYFPLFPLEILQQDMRYFKSLGLLGVQPETLPDGPDGANLHGKPFESWLQPERLYETYWDSNSLLHFAAARLAWNPDESLEYIISLFCRNYYGPVASEAMTRYHLALNRNMYMSGHPGEVCPSPQISDFVNTGTWCFAWSWNTNIGDFSKCVFLTTDRDQVGQQAKLLLKSIFAAKQAALNSGDRISVDRVERDVSLLRMYLLYSGYEIPLFGTNPVFTRNP